MATVNFYHLQRSPLHQALPRLLERVLAAGHRAVLIAGSTERVEALNALLWTYEPDSWLPHGSAADGEPAEHPIWLTDREENPNGADVLVVVDGAAPATLAGYARCLDLFDGNDPAAVEAARRRWSQWRGQGHELVYHQQGDSGGWVEKQRVPAQPG